MNKFHKNIHILVVDDEEIMRNFLSDMLRDEGYEVQAVASGEEGINLLQKSDFDLVVTDLKMPGFSGIDVLKAVKQQNSNTYVIMITGYASVETAVESMKLGAVDYITKPFEMDQIKNVIRVTLEKAKK
ncbi:MAG: sigma-54-dependent Fis family transcriptional regulator [Candidatus Aureabacteria bacterium]|nr:sigma-54-dependent Fis family transcriptional regulator [Candidatus Auribacterota bacterium]